MAIGSKKSLGKNSMYVQAKRGGRSSSRRKSGSTSLKSTGKSSNTSDDQDAIDTNAGNDFYSKFKDTSLESQLIQRGFSSMRPEIIGAFEFIPPLSSDTEDVSQAQGQVVYDTTSSGELISMSEQLKALRCKQAMQFLTKNIGLKPKRTRGQISWHHAGPGSNVLTNALWKPFYFDMQKAKSVLNFLSAALLLTDFGRVTDIKLNRYLTVNRTGRQWDMTGGKRAAQGIATRLEAYRGSFIKNKAPGKMSLNEYLTTFLEYPEDYLKNVSSSALMMQLLADAAARIIYPKTSFSNISTPSGQFGPMCLPGVSFKKNRDYRVTSQLSQLSETVKIIGESSEPTYNRRQIAGNPLLKGINTATENPLLETEETGTDYYTKGDFFDLWTVVNDRKNPKPFYIVARDFMNHCAQTQLSQESAMPTRTSTQNTLKSLLGFNPFASYDNIADIPTSAGDVLGLNAFRKSIGENTVVATFNEGWGDTESGDTSAITGQSYFVDDFFKNGERGIKVGVKRFSDLKTSLSDVKGKLFRFSKQRITPKVGFGASFKNTYIANAAGAKQIKYQADYSGPGVPGIKLVGQRTTGNRLGRKSLEGPGTFFQRIWTKITQGIYLNYGSRTGPMPSGNIQDNDNEGWYGEAVQYQVFMAAALDRDVAWAAFRYYLAYQNKLSRGTGTGAQTADDASRRLENESRLLADEIWRFYGLDEKTDTAQSIKFYGNGYDADEAPLDLHDSVEGVPSPWGFAQSPSWTGLDSQRSTDQVDGGERLRTDYAGAWKDSFLRPGNDFKDKKDFINVLAGSRTDAIGSPQPLTIFKDITEAVEEWESVMIAEYGVGDNVKKGAKTGDLKIDMWGRVIVGYMISLVIFRECLTLCHIRPTWVSAIGMHHPSIISFGYSRRAVNSVGYCSWLYNKMQTSREEILADSRYGPVNSGAWEPGFYSTNSDGLVGTTGAPSADAVRDILDIFYTYHIPLLEWDVLVWNNLYYITEICDSVISVINEIASTFSDAGSNSLITEMKKIQADPSLGDQLFDMITPEQVRLSRYIYDSLSTENRKYPYLPASSGIVPYAAKNLGTISRLPIFLDTDGIQDKRIFAIGLPAGLVEFLRRSASRSLVSSDFNTSSIVKLSVWRRNLLTETTAQLPVEYLFDVKRFMLDGRRSAPKASKGTKGIGGRHDSARKYFPGQTLDDLFKNARICRYTDSGLAAIYAGTAYSDKALSAARDNGSLSALSDKILPTCINYAGKSKTILDEIFYNHVVDHYLKLYLKLTSGIDVREEVFCFQNDKTQITGPDKDKEVLRKEWEEKLRSLFETRDMASRLTYQRMLGELDRSIFLSSEKYKNRIIYPKIFDRVFCIYIDESMWKDDVPESNESTNIESGQNAYENVSAESEATILSLGSSDSPTYYQYYVTVSIISELANKS